MTVETHEHSFTSTVHVDGCHWFLWSYACACGASATSRYERDVEDDPYSELWFDEDCERCTELRKGATPQASVIVYRADGSVELERS